MTHQIPNPVRLLIVEDHQSIIDGYAYRLQKANIAIVATARFGVDVEPALEAHPADVLVLDIHLPTSASNPAPFPILPLVMRLRRWRPQLRILAISMLTQSSLVETLFEAGVSGYICKDDFSSIQQLDKIIELVAQGGTYFSQGAYEGTGNDPARPRLTARQIEVISLCAAYPDDDTRALARRLNVSPSTFRNLLSACYRRLGVRSRTSAVSRAQQLGLIAHSWVK